MTPIGSRRIIEVCPAMYSPATAPCRLRTAPAKKRKQSEAAGISSCSMRIFGLPVLSASSAAKDSASLSMASANFNRRVERAAGVVRDQVWNAFSAALTAASTWAGVASGSSTIFASVLGLSTASASPAPATNFEPINICVSSMDGPPLESVFRLFRRPACVLALARQIVGGEDRQKRDENDEDRDHVGDRALPRPDQLRQHPDRQGRLLAGREGRDDHFVEGERKGEHAAGE